MADISFNEETKNSALDSLVDSSIRGKIKQRDANCEPFKILFGSSNPHEVSTASGIPAWLCLFISQLFEGLSPELASTIHYDAMGAIRVGSDFHSIRMPMIQYIALQHVESIDSNLFPAHFAVADNIYDELIAPEINVSLMRALWAQAHGVINNIENEFLPVNKTLNCLADCAYASYTHIAELPCDRSYTKSEFYEPFSKKLLALLGGV